MHCVINNSTLLLCPTPALGPEARHASVTVHFLMDNLSFEFEEITGIPFTYELNPILYPLNQEDHSKPYRHKPGSILSVEVTHDLSPVNTQHTELEYIFPLYALYTCT